MTFVLITQHRRPTQTRHFNSPLQLARIIAMRCGAARCGAYCIVASTNWMQKSVREGEGTDALKTMDMFARHRRRKRDGNAQNDTRKAIRRDRYLSLALQLIR